MKHIITMLLTALALQASAQVKTEIGKFNLAGPYAVAAPFATDTVDVKGKKFDNNSLLSALPLKAEAGSVFRAGRLPSLKDSKAATCNWLPSTTPSPSATWPSRTTPTASG